MPEPYVDHAADDLIQTAVAALLRRIPERWKEYDADSLTATESRALFLLVAAGMVERRIRFRMHLHIHPVAVEATVTATGECGFAEAMEPVLASMWTDWKDAFQAWRTGETGSAPAAVTEPLKPDEWRLTDQGVLARVDLNDGHARRALDFVLRRGFFDGNPRLILGPGGPRISRRAPIRGAGQLVTMRKVRVDAVSPAEVNVGNWTEGAEAFAAAFQKLIGNGRHPQADAASHAQSSELPGAASAPPSWEQRVADYLTAHQKHLDRMRDAYLSIDGALGDTIYHQHFTPTVIARAITGNDSDRGAVGRTSAYKAGVQKSRNGERWPDANI